MVKNIIVIYRKNENVFILISSKSYFHILKNQYLKSSLALRRHYKFGSWLIRFWCPYLIKLSKFSHKFPRYFYERGQEHKYFNIAPVLQGERLTIITCPANTCIKVYAIKNIRE